MNSNQSHGGMYHAQLQIYEQQNACGSARLGTSCMHSIQTCLWDTILGLYLASGWLSRPFLFQWRSCTAASKVNSNILPIRRHLHCRLFLRFSNIWVADFLRDTEGGHLLLLYHILILGLGLWTAYTHSCIDLSCRQENLWHRPIAGKGGTAHLGISKIGIPDLRGLGRTEEGFEPEMLTLKSLWSPEKSFKRCVVNTRLPSALLFHYTGSLR